MSFCTHKSKIFANFLCTNSLCASSRGNIFLSLCVKSVSSFKSLHKSVCWPLLFYRFNIDGILFLLCFCHCNVQTIVAEMLLMLTHSISAESWLTNWVEQMRLTLEEKGIAEQNLLDLWCYYSVSLAQIQYEGMFLSVNPLGMNWCFEIFSE